MTEETENTAPVKPKRKRAAKKAVKKAAPKAPAKKAPKRKSAAAAMSDAAVKAKTGRTWSQWFTVLDKAGAAKMTHAAIAKLIATRHKIPGWWAQAVTVAYERARGLRKVNETLSGFRTSVSRTVDAGKDAAFEAWDNAKTRAAFLKEAVDFSTRNPGKNLRFTWKMGRVEVRFVVKGPKKTQVTVDHTGLKTAAAARRFKAQWAETMDKLGDKLAAKLPKRLKKA